MKKIILSFATMLAFGSVNAQIKTDAGTFTKPTAGTYIMEINFAPNVTGTGVFSLPTLNNDLGVLGIKARKFTSDKKAYRFVGNVSVLNSGVDGEDTEFTVGAGFGIENHMKGAERLSTYWGYEGSLAYVSMNANAIDPKMTKFGFGANIFAGFDYYIMPKIYMGAEVAYGLAISNTKPDGGDSTTKIQLQPGITPFFRLGWQF